MPGDDLFRNRQRGTHHKRRKVEMFVSGGSGQDTLLLARSAQFNSIVASG
jgi:hypothetical protein